jgi:hypothetical protein
MKILLISFLCIISLQLHSQQWENNISFTNRKVYVEDSLDIKLNMLVDSFPPLYSLNISYNARNNNWRSAMVYTKDNDTLTGEIRNKIHSTGKTSIFLLYRKDSLSEKIKFRSDKIRGYEYNNRKFFPKKFSGLPPGFIEQLNTGRLNLYYTKYIVIQSGYDAINNRPYNTREEIILEIYLEITEKDNDELIGPIPLKQKQFKKYITPYISDCPGLLDKINNDKYTIQHIREIISLYNACF